MVGLAAAAAAVAAAASGGASEVDVEVATGCGGCCFFLALRAARRSLMLSWRAAALALALAPPAAAAMAAAGLAAVGGASAKRLRLALFAPACASCASCAAPPPAHLDLRFPPSMGSTYKSPGPCSYLTAGRCTRSGGCVVVGVWGVWGDAGGSDAVMHGARGVVVSHPIPRPVMPHPRSSDVD